MRRRKRPVIPGQRLIAAAPILGQTDTVTHDLGRLTPVDIREVWRHEAYDFTTWLLDNADVLSEALGMDLELTRAEHAVGRFSLDLIGTDLASGDVVIIENQLEKTNHGHLGQLLTYAGGTDPATIVWCSPSFQEEHRAALDWLNEHTDERTRFFGIEIAAVRIDDSRPAPLFRVVAKPNDWTKQVHTERAAASASVTPREEANQNFWAELLRRIRERHPDWTKATTGSKQNWITLPYGTSGVSYGLVFGRTHPRVELYIGSPDAERNTQLFEKFVEHRDLLDHRLGAGISYEPLPGKAACRIAYEREEPGDVLDSRQHDALMDWFIDTLERFRPVTQDIKVLLAAEGSVAAPRPSVG